MLTKNFIYSFFFSVQKIENCVFCCLYVFPFIFIPIFPFRLSFVATKRVFLVCFVTTRSWLAHNLIFFCSFASLQYRLLRVHITNYNESCLPAVGTDYTDKYVLLLVYTGIRMRDKYENKNKTLKNFLFIRPKSWQEKNFNKRDTSMFKRNYIEVKTETCILMHFNFYESSKKETHCI